MIYGSTCSNCRARISGVSTLCVRCAKLIKFSGRKCTICHAPIGKSSRSGLCTKCRKRETRGGKSKYVDEMQSVRSVLVKRKTGKWTTCHMPGCDEYFELREGQHPSMAWCNRCRQTPNYKNHGTYDTMTRSMKR